LALIENPKKLEKRHLCYISYYSSPSTKINH